MINDEETSARHCGPRAAISPRFPFPRKEIADQVRNDGAGEYSARHIDPQGNDKRDNGRRHDVPSCGRIAPTAHRISFLCTSIMRTRHAVSLRERICEVAVGKRINAQGLCSFRPAIRGGERWQVSPVRHCGLRAAIPLPPRVKHGAGSAGDERLRCHEIRSRTNKNKKIRKISQKY